MEIKLQLHEVTNSLQKVNYIVLELFVVSRSVMFPWISTLHNTIHNASHTTRQETLMLKFAKSWLNVMPICMAIKI